MNIKECYKRVKTELMVKIVYKILNLVSYKAAKDISKIIQPILKKYVSSLKDNRKGN